MGVIELRARIAMDTPLGRGYALLVETNAEDQWWTVALAETRALVTFQQSKIRVARSYGYGIGMTDEDMLKVLR